MIRQQLVSTREALEAALKRRIEDLGPQTLLRDACEYALLNGGKRFRPTIVQWVCRALGSEARGQEAALAVEYFHCASLVADDLPCMDDDDMRRDKPSVHKVHGDAVAILVTYALIAEGYDLLRKGGDRLTIEGDATRQESDRICALAVEAASRCTGIFGATGGQYLDLYPPELDEDKLREILELKTVVLFELAFVLGWLYGGGDRDAVSKVRQLSYHFGIAFQIADDIHDLEQDAKKERPVNLALQMGVTEARAAVARELGAYRTLLVELCMDSVELRGLAELVEARAQQECGLAPCQG